MNLPNFIVFGTRKAGTTSIYHYLAQHPEVYMSTLKGTRYFMYDSEKPEENAQLPVKTLEQYSSYFVSHGQGGIKAVGEVSPSYLSCKSAAQRIRKTIPDVKLIASLRNPVDKLYSQYQMDMRQRAKADRVELTRENASQWLSPGLYSKQMQEYIDQFRREQIKIYIFEEWIKEPSSMIQDMYEFLGIDSSFLPDLKTQYNAGGAPRNEVVGNLLKHRPVYIKFKPFVPKFLRTGINRLRNSNMEKAPPLSVKMREYIGSLYVDDIQNLRKLLNEDISAWEV